MHLLKYTCQWYAPFTWPWLVRSFHQLPFICSVCWVEYSGFKVQCHPDASLSPWIICGWFSGDWTSPRETIWCCGRHAVWLSLVSYALGSLRWIQHFNLVAIWLLMTCKLTRWWTLPVLKFISSARVSSVLHGLWYKCGACSGLGVSHPCLGWLSGSAWLFWGTSLYI